jgi:mono/diheme cytochrome c family protein
MGKIHLAGAAVLAVTSFAIGGCRNDAQGAGQQVSGSSSYSPTPEAVAAAAAQFAKGKTAGQEVFNRNCAACHGNGIKFPGTVALTAKYQGSLPGALEDRTDLTPEIVRYFVRNGVSIMPGYRKSQITDKELNDLADYLSKKS